MEKFNHQADFFLFLQGGVQTNVVPEKLTVAFDIRLAVTVDFDEFEALVIFLLI